LLTSGGRSGSYTSYIFKTDDELPSLVAMLAEGIVPPAIVVFLALSTHFGWGVASPFVLAILFMVMPKSVYMHVDSPIYSFNSSETSLRDVLV